MRVPTRARSTSDRRNRFDHPSGVQLLKAEAEIKDIVHVPYRGVAPAVTDMLGDHIQMITADVPFLLPHITYCGGAINRWR